MGWRAAKRAPAESGARRSISRRQLALAGALPAGDDGSFLQSVPLSRWRLGADPALRFIDAPRAPREAEYGADYDVLEPGSAAGLLRVQHVGDGRRAARR